MTNPPLAPPKRGVRGHLRRIRCVTPRYQKFLLFQVQKLFCLMHKRFKLRLRSGVLRAVVG